MVNEQKSVVVLVEVIPFLPPSRSPSRRPQMAESILNFRPSLRGVDGKKRACRVPLPHFLKNSRRLHQIFARTGNLTTKCLHLLVVYEGGVIPLVAPPPRGSSEGSLLARQGL